MKSVQNGASQAHLPETPCLQDAHEKLRLEDAHEKLHLEDAHEKPRLGDALRDGASKFLISRRGRLGDALKAS